MKQIQYEELSTSVLTQLINSKSSFEVIGLSGRLMNACSLVENKIETTGCGFHDTWTLSPRSFGHSFHAHLDT